MKAIAQIVCNIFIRKFFYEIFFTKVRGNWPELMILWNLVENILGRINMLLMHETVLLNHVLQVQFIIYHLWMEPDVVRSQLAQHKVWKIKSPAFIYNLLFLSQNIIPFDLHWTLDLDKHALVLLSFMSPWDLYPSRKPTLILLLLKMKQRCLFWCFNQRII